MMMQEWIGVLENTLRLPTIWRVVIELIMVIEML